MTLFARIRTALGTKAENALDRLEDPRDVLEAAYRRQIAALETSRRGVAEVLTAEKRLEIEAAALLATIERHRASARAAAEAGDGEVARRALVREAFSLAQRERLLAQAAGIATQRRALEATVERLQMRLELFRTERLAIGASLSAARASTLASETLGGFSAEAAAVAQTVERARERTRAAQARAAALAQLVAGDDVLAPGELARVDARLAALESP